MAIISTNRGFYSTRLSTTQINKKKPHRGLPENNDSPLDNKWVQYIRNIHGVWVPAVGVVHVAATGLQIHPTRMDLL
jgi:hypothetical protein